ncbi:hypothetical protein T07_7665 [Trichinella nelsoni]|uniref:Uncharacterized protein n=1 Tax=Trichinella nelsoni TaxID=6336 RepID=A0A0V0RN00_9BILA|nr:hypothetical protein T07_7665 [Trichinella nelsoni]
MFTLLIRWITVFKFVGIDLAVNIALLWPSWLAVGDATAHAEQAESSSTTTTITITISTTSISGCKQTYVVEIEKFDFFRRPAAFGTRTPFARNGSACESNFPIKARMTFSKLESKCRCNEQ